MRALAFCLALLLVSCAAAPREAALTVCQRLWALADTSAVAYEAWRAECSPLPADRIGS